MPGGEIYGLTSAELHGASMVFLEGVPAALIASLGLTMWWHLRTTR